MTWDTKATGYANAIFVISVFWKKRHTPDGRVTVKRAIAQARACNGKKLNRRRSRPPRDPSMRGHKRIRPITGNTGKRAI